MRLPWRPRCLRTRGGGWRAPTCAGAAHADTPLSARNTRGTTRRSGTNCAGSGRDLWRRMKTRGFTIYNLRFATYNLDSVGVSTRHRSICGNHHGRPWQRMYEQIGLATPRHVQCRRHSYHAHRNWRCRRFAPPRAQAELQSCTARALLASIHSYNYCVSKSCIIADIARVCCTACVASASVGSYSPGYRNQRW
mgnify:CR=1 FL=1